MEGMRKKGAKKGGRLVGVEEGGRDIDGGPPFLSTLPSLGICHHGLAVT